MGSILKPHSDLYRPRSIKRLKDPKRPSTTENVKWKHNDDPELPSTHYIFVLVNLAPELVNSAVNLNNPKGPKTTVKTRQRLKINQNGSSSNRPLNDAQRPPKTLKQESSPAGASVLDFEDAAAPRCGHNDVVFFLFLVTIIKGYRLSISRNV